MTGSLRPSDSVCGGRVTSTCMRSFLPSPSISNSVSTQRSLLIQDWGLLKPGTTWAWPSTKTGTVFAAWVAGTVWAERYGEEADRTAAIRICHLMEWVMEKLLKGQRFRVFSAPPGTLCGWWFCCTCNAPGSDLLVSGKRMV